jgi:hypothetical protein
VLGALTAGAHQARESLERAWAYATHARQLAPGFVVALCGTVLEDPAREGWTDARQQLEVTLGCAVEIEWLAVAQRACEGARLGALRAISLGIESRELCRVSSSFAQPLVAYVRSQGGERKPRDQRSQRAERGQRCE